MKITSHQVHKIMNLVTVHKEAVPQLLDLLNAIVKVEELDLPLKRNQSFVMQYFMQYRADIAHVIDQDENARYVIKSTRMFANLLCFTFCFKRPKSMIISNSIL